MSQRIQIQQAIRDIVAAGKFYEVRYDKNTGNPIPLPTDLTTATLIVPGTVQVNETSVKFALDKRMGRREAMTVTEWPFDLYLEFPVEVTLEYFWNSLLDPPPRIASDPSKGFRQVTLYVAGAPRIVHPTQQSIRKGTEVTLAFVARLGKV